MSSRKRLTSEVLSERFVDVSTSKIDEDYLNRELKRTLENYEDLYDRLKWNKRIDYIVQDALVRIANELLNTEIPDGTLNASRRQVLEWLNQYGRGDDTIAETLDFVAKERMFLRNYGK